MENKERLQIKNWYFRSQSKNFKTSFIFKTVFPRLLWIDLIERICVTNQRLGLFWL